MKTLTLLVMLLLFAFVGHIETTTHAIEYELRH